MARKDYIVGSGNVFEDLGHPRPAEALAKAELARKIAALIAERGLTQASAAELLKIDQPKVSALVRGRLAGFSLDRLVRFLVLLGSDVEIVVKPRRRATAARGCWLPEIPVRNLYTDFGQRPRRIAGQPPKWLTMDRFRGVGSRRRDQEVANSVPNTQPIHFKHLKSFRFRERVSRP